MLLDLHVHTIRYSPCSQIHPADLIYTARLLGIDGFAITEHNQLWREEEVEELRRDTGEKEMIILRGQEIRSFDENNIAGDILIFGYPESIETPISSKDLLKKIHAFDAVAIAAHPYRECLGLGDRIFDLDLDGIEIYNSNHTAQATRRAMAARDSLSCAGIGASDAHDLVHIGHYLTFFQRPITTEKELVREIKDRRCKPVSFSQLPSPQD